MRNRLALRPWLQRVEISTRREGSPPRQTGKSHHSSAGSPVAESRNKRPSFRGALKSNI
jgi:hypothetical protein